MDSEGVTNLNEMEKASPEAKSNQGAVETKATEEENQEINLDESELTLKTEKTNDALTKNENKEEEEENSHIEMSVDTKKKNDEGSSPPSSEIKTSVTVIVNEANTEGDEESCTKTKTTIDKENEMENIVNIAKNHNVTDNELEEIKKPKVDPPVTFNENNAISAKSATEELEETECGEIPSADDNDTKTEAVKEINAEKIDSVQGESEIVAQLETTELPENTEEDLICKTNNASMEINNQIKNIISDIDINIKAQEKISQLKEQELELIQKQKELANQIHQQQLLAQKLIAQNQLKEQEYQAQLQKQQQQQQQQQFKSENQYEKEAAVPKVSQEYTKWNNRHEDHYNITESSNVSRTVDLRKIFTPATDAPQILPKNRKLYASSAFYSPTLHPTVEDQVELARRISHSLSDISNQKSKGQSMYVNRKKRSVKWVHEASGQDEETQSLSKENAEANLITKPEKMPLKLVMNPRGQVRDYNSQMDSINVESGLLSPDNCAELITALQLHKGRGAELFAKRRRKADNWVVDETNAGIHSPSGIPDYHQYQQARHVISPNILPAYSDAGKHRVQLNIHQDQLIEKYSKPDVQVVKSPWEAALQTGSASTAFVEGTRYHQRQTPNDFVASPSPPVQSNQDLLDHSGSTSVYPLKLPSYCNPSNSYHDLHKTAHDTAIQPCNTQRELAYKPTVAQGWGGRNVELPKGLYVPKEISLSSYAAPPTQTRGFHGSAKVDLSKGYHNSPTVDVHPEFSISNATMGSSYTSVTPKQQLYDPASYQKLSPSSVQSVSQVNFNPSPLPYDKLSKFQETDQRYLNVNKSRTNSSVHSASPTSCRYERIEGRPALNNKHQQQLIPTKHMPQQQIGNYEPNRHQIQSPLGQCFNNSARGWRTAPNTTQQYAFCSKIPVMTTECLPYSDF